MKSFNAKRIKEGKMSENMSSTKKEFDRFVDGLLKIPGRKEVYIMTAHNEPVNLNPAFEGGTVDKGPLDFRHFADFEIDAEGNVGGIPIREVFGFAECIGWASVCDGSIWIISHPADDDRQRVFYTISIFNFEWEYLLKERFDNEYDAYIKYMESMLGKKLDWEFGNCSDYWAVA